MLKSAFAALKENGFVLSRENPCCEVTSDLHPDITVVTVHRTLSETILLLRKQSQRRKARYIEINSDDFSWLHKVQDVLKKKPYKDLVLYTEDPTSGILGMVKCLRKESVSGNIRCMFIMNEGEEFDPNCKIFSDQLHKNMAFNVYKNGQWGTFRHLPLEDSNIVESEHCFVNIISRGDLSSFTWIEGALTHRTTPELGEELIYVSKD